MSSPLLPISSSRGGGTRRTAKDWIFERCCFCVSGTQRSRHSASSDVNGGNYRRPVPTNESSARLWSTTSSQKFSLASNDFALELDPSLLGEVLLSNDGKVSVSQVFDTNVVIAIWFWSHGCDYRGDDNCKYTFTELLHKAHTEFHADGFEIIYVGSDESEEDFMAQLSTTPWLAVPYEGKYGPIRQALIDASGLSANPVFKEKGCGLLLVDSMAGTLIASDGYGHLLTYWAKYPWTDMPRTPMSEVPWYPSKSQSRTLSEAASSRVTKVCSDPNAFPLPPSSKQDLIRGSASKKKKNKPCCVIV